MDLYSNSIEGNTLTLRETQLVLQKGVTIWGKLLHEISVNYEKTLKNR